MWKFENNVNRCEARNDMEALEAMACDAPGLGLGAPLKVSHRLSDFTMNVPFAKQKNFLALSKMKFQNLPFLR